MNRAIIALFAAAAIAISFCGCSKNNSKGTSGKEPGVPIVTSPQDETENGSNSYEQNEKSGETKANGKNNNSETTEKSTGVSSDTSSADDNGTSESSEKVYRTPIVPLD